MALIAPVPVSSARAATAVVSAVKGIMVEPDGSGARIAVALDGPFHYWIDRRTDRVVILLDPVSAAAADHTLAIGPVRSLRVRSLTGTPPRAEITVFTSAPVEAADSFLDGQTLAVRLTAGRRPASTAPGSAPSVPVRTPVALPSAGQPDSPPGAAAAAPGSALPERIAGRTVVARAVTLEEGTGRLLDVDHLTRVAVSDPRIVGVVPVSGRELLVAARAAGRATVYVWEGRDVVVAYAVEVRGGADPYRDLRHALAALLPDSAITVTEVHGAGSGAAAPVPAGSAPPSGASYAPLLRSDGSRPSGAASDGRGAVLSGTVETQIDRAKAEEVARAFVSVVVNLLTIRRPVQFSLHVEVVELNRNAQDALGISWGGGQQTPGSPPSLNGGVYNLQLITAPGLATNGLDLLIAQLEALSQRGQARLLARPGLVVLAGRTASMLLGGQVPVPVAGANGTVTIEYKDFGVILTARPDYQDDGRVFLQITPEVSTLDFTDAIKVSGFVIPALRVRRAQTMVAMRPGETLVLGGLLQRDDVELVQKVPLLADLPIIGALFRSRSFQRHESDLLILVTPQLVESPHTP